MELLRLRPSQFHYALDLANYLCKYDLASFKATLKEVYLFPTLYGFELHNNKKF